MPAVTLLLSAAALATFAGGGREKGEPQWFLGKPLARVDVTEGWGSARDGRAAHGALDLRAPVGTAALAAGPGRVRFAGEYADGSGHAVELDHGDGLFTRYLHLQRVTCETGDQVLQGQQVGETGFAKSPHLHFDVSVDAPLVEFYRRRFGEAKFLGTLGVKVAGKVRQKVPAEPLIPVDGYQDDVIKSARLFAVRLRDDADVVA